jgi:hypothetical protein
MPFPGLWGRFDRILLVREQRFSVPKFSIFVCQNLQFAYNLVVRNGRRRI